MKFSKKSEKHVSRRGPVFFSVTGKENPGWWRHRRRWRTSWWMKVRSLRTHSEMSCSSWSSSWIRRKRTRRRAEPTPLPPRSPTAVSATPPGAEMKTTSASSPRRAWTPTSSKPRSLRRTPRRRRPPPPPTRIEAGDQRQPAQQRHGSRAHARFLSSWIICQHTELQIRVE